MEKEEIKKLANDLLFEPSEKVIKLTNNLLNSIEKGLKDLEEFDLQDIKPMSHINESPICFKQLRSDEPDKSFYLNKQDLLNNASEHDENYVIMKKVINDK
ncbi:aspartyl/glutamyl-tRNA amidotransferase subunit C [Mycoplasma hominis]|uniref:Asp-tRNA(Asn)/Glu-tRNA(Gln) amidotransferase subunit GatC n=1 Tax=Metamycoplasma hominis TaxID=2098 RepID=UPI00174756B1|nr:Asp-tRNA(Asn)/Glu-tRNA(Gln) amidotransferase subunit GatC [Metamycoplasma hominis]MBD3898925.1 aspartyl/glutamyl-tRNA amidotransferase subunit C [Metamycoplasma hominis]